MANLLVIEDELGLADFLRMELELQGHVVDVALTGADGLAYVRRAHYDAVLLDLMLPDMPGLDVCRSIRNTAPLLPIIILTARGVVADRVAGLDAGADDYLVKPFAIEELMARLRAQVRRQHTTIEEQPNQLVIGDGSLVIYPDKRKVVFEDETVDLTAREYELLLFFLRHPGQVLSRFTLLQEVWGFHSPVDTNVVDVYIGYLRQKVDPHKQHIHTVRGAGYLFRLDAP